MAEIRYNDIVPRSQLKVIDRIVRSEGGMFLWKRMQQLTAALQTTPVLGEAAKAHESAIIYWRYFESEGDGNWYITQLDPDSLKAFGFVKLGVSEFRDIDLNELLKQPTVCLDLYWAPKSVREVTYAVRTDNYEVLARTAAKVRKKTDRKEKRTCHYSIKTAERELYD